MKNLIIMSAILMSGLIYTSAQAQDRDRGRYEHNDYRFRGEHRRYDYYHRDFRRDRDYHRDHDRFERRYGRY